MRYIILLLTLGMVVCMLADAQAEHTNPSPPQPLLEREVCVDKDKYTWTWTDTGLQVATITLSAMDWAQTLHIARNMDPGHDYYEAGMARTFIGRQPSEGRVNAYFAASIALNTAVAYLLPKPYRTGWQIISIGMEYNCVQQNRAIGIGVSLHF